MSAFVFESDLPADVVLQRLRARDKEWRESQLPEGARQAGFFAVRVRVDAPRFRLQFRGGGRNPYFPRLDGWVESTATGSRTHARARPTNMTLVAFIPLLAWVLLVVREGGALGALFSLLGIAAFGAAFAFGYARAQPWLADLVEVLRRATQPEDSAASLPMSRVELAE